MKHKETFLVTGATSGLGLAVAKELLIKNHQLILVARSESLLKEIYQNFPEQITYYIGDLSDEKFVSELINSLPDNLSGVFINAGGPPAKTTAETTLSDWDEAYKLLVRWKIQLSKGLLPKFLKNGYGRIIFSESTSVTRPVENLVLSNSLRMAIVGFVRTLVGEYKNSGITFNVMAPGYHETRALERLYNKIGQQHQISINQAKGIVTQKIPTGKTGDVMDYASLAVWLLGPQSGFVTGQVINIDGGVSV